MSKPANERYRMAVDFDGVLHSYTTPWIDAATIPDPPVPGAIAWLMEIQKRLDVVIHTTRGATAGGYFAVLRWLWDNGYREGDEAYDWHQLKITVTDKKPAALVYIDDRAFRFEGRFPTAEEIHRMRPWNKVGAPPKTKEGGELALPGGVGLFRDGSGWLVQAEHFDYFAGGDTPEDAIKNFKDGLLLTILRNLERNGRWPLESTANERTSQ